jgi:broad specificity phosphatase PhoE
MRSVTTRVQVMRHGERPYEGHEPQLTEKGHAQARAAADALLRAGPIDAIFSSPMIRALQTAAPVAEVAGLPIRVERGFCELLAHGWLYAADPLPGLLYENRARAPLPSVPAHLLAPDSGSPAPPYPDHHGVAEPGNAEQRAGCLRRYRSALERVLGAAEAEGARTVLIVGHGATGERPASLTPAATR